MRLRGIPEQTLCVSHSVMSDPLQPKDCSPPGSSVHGIFQARLWSGLPFPSPEDLPNPRIERTSPVSCIAGRFFTHWAIREARTDFTDHEWLSVPNEKIANSCLACKAFGRLPLSAGALFVLWPCSCTHPLPLTVPLLIFSLHLSCSSSPICMSRSQLFKAKLTHHCNEATLLLPAGGHLSSQDVQGTLF